MEKLEKVNKVKEFLDEARVFYIVTVDKDKPRSRPIGFKMIQNDELYFGVGTFKDVYKQLQENPNIEIVATTPKMWLRLDGKAVFDNDDALVDACFKAMPEIEGLYKANGWKMGIFHIENVHAEFKEMISTKEIVEW